MEPVLADEAEAAAAAIDAVLAGDPGAFDIRRFELEPGDVVWPA